MRSKPAPCSLKYQNPALRPKAAIFAIQRGQERLQQSAKTAVFTSPFIAPYCTLLHPRSLTEKTANRCQVREFHANQEATGPKIPL
jgi:hypothetical protein